MNLSLDQQLAISTCVDLTTKLVGITGEAGTGKTTVLGQVADELEAKGVSFWISATTGRAAARIREHTGHRATTVHRMLGWGMPDPNDPDDTGFPARGPNNPIPAKVVIVEESSMMSDDLYRAVINALARGAVIRFFGDANQLPPVQGESPFHRILEKFTSVRLTHNYRSTSGIIQAAQTILRGRLPQPNEQFRVLNIGASMGLTTLDKFIDESYLTPAAQVIAPTMVGKMGTDIVNAHIQSRLNKSTRSMHLKYDTDEGVKGIVFRPGDKILWTKNDYTLGLMNGTVGMLLDFNKIDGDMFVNFNGRDQTIPAVLTGYNPHNGKEFHYDPRKYIDLAYAITTHKSQGSEFDRVIILLSRSRIASRNNFYTAVTRARKQVTVLAAPGGLTASLRKEQSYA